MTRGDLLVRGAAAALGLTRVGSVVAAAPPPRFRSRPDLDPPRVHVISAPDLTAPGVVFVANANGERQPGPMILDDGELIWFEPRPGLTVMNFNAHTLSGKPVLGWWEGTLTGSHGAGEFVLLGPDYREVGRVVAGNGLVTDFHEFSLSARGTALLIAYADDGQLLDSAVQEIDVATGTVLLDWRASDHIGSDESYVSPTTGAFDFAHLNAAAVDDDGHLLISSRHTWTVYKVDRSTGDVVWRLGGRRSDFAFGDGASFAWQHHARRHRDGTLTVFDNGAGVAQTEPYSRGLQLALHESAGTATLVREFAHPDRLSASAAAASRIAPTVAAGPASRSSGRRSSSQAARATRAGTARPRWRTGGSASARKPTSSPRATSSRAAPSRRSSRCRAARGSRPSRRSTGRAACSAGRRF